jgi:hypothetical protein
MPRTSQVLVPSLSLLAQTLASGPRTPSAPFPTWRSGSDETVVGEDAVVSTSSELPEQGSADAEP